MVDITDITIVFMGLTNKLTFSRITFGGTMAPAEPLGEEAYHPT